MKKLLLGMMIAGSFSTFANVDLNGSDIYKGKSSEVIDVQFRSAPGSTDRCMTKAYDKAILNCKKDGYSKCEYVAKESKSRRTLKSRLGITTKFIQKRTCKVYVQGSNE
ncbi:MAG: hypothetical protein N4A33_13515 [Bacteriovoracaceae bacterium]|jgi:hypothetical protein|nr:hypothetical protein [Bacteriovoracaceae bacterium]